MASRPVQSQPKFVKRRGLGTPEGRAYQKHMAAAWEKRKRAAAAANGGENVGGEGAPCMPLPRKPRKKPELLHGVLLPHEVAAMRQTFSIALNRQAQKGGNSDGLEKQGFKSLLKEICKDAGLSPPSGKDLGLAFEVADDDGGGSVRVWHMQRARL